MSAVQVCVCVFVGGGLMSHGPKEVGGARAHVCVMLRQPEAEGKAGLAGAAGSRTQRTAASPCATPAPVATTPAAAAGPSDATLGSAESRGGPWNCVCGGRGGRRHTTRGARGLDGEGAGKIPGRQQPWRRRPAGCVVAMLMVCRGCSSTATHTTASLATHHAPTGGEVRSERIAGRLGVLVDHPATRRQVGRQTRPHVERPMLQFPPVQSTWLCRMAASACAAPRWYGEGASTVQRGCKAMQWVRCAPPW